MIGKNMIECVKAISQGFSHKSQGKPCQDSVIAGIDKNKTYSILAVADGHGGEKYFRSEKGSKFAVKLARNQMVEFAKRFEKIKSEPANSEKPLTQEDIERLIEENAKLIESRVLFKWREYIKSDFKENPLSEKEKKLCEKLKLKVGTEEETEKDILSLYGTTLLVSLYLPRIPFFLSLQIGDGLTFALDENNEEIYPIPENESLGVGYTTSLCSSTAAESFRHAYGFSKLNAIVVCSDGVSDSFEKNKFGDFVKKIRDNINEHGCDAVQKELQEFFPKLSEQGSGDDVSLAGVFEVEEK